MREGLPDAALFCLGMAALAAAVALVPRWRRSWGWGRGGSAGPISGVGCASIVRAFLVMGAGFESARRGWFDPFYSLLMALGAFALFVAAGVYDSVRNRARKRKPR